MLLCSKRQQAVALPSVESEYVAALVCAAEGAWLRRLAAELGVTMHVPHASTQIAQVQQILLKIQSSIRGLSMLMSGIIS